MQAGFVNRPGSDARFPAAFANQFALEAVKRIDAVFDVEREIVGLSAAERLRARQGRSVDLVEALLTWMRVEHAKLSRHAEVAKAIDYMLKRRPAFTRFLDDCRICLTNNAAERALRGLALAESSGCSPVRTAARIEPPSCTRSSRPPSSTKSPPRPGSPTFSPALQTRHIPGSRRLLPWNWTANRKRQKAA